MMTSSPHGEGGETAFVNFEEKHYFDSAITVRYIKRLGYVIYLDKKIGSIWNCAYQHYSKEVQKVIDELTRAELIVVMYGSHL